MNQTLLISHNDSPDVSVTISVCRSRQKPETWAIKDRCGSSDEEKRGAAVLPVGKPIRNLTSGCPVVAESAGFQCRAGPVHSVWVLRAQVFILFKVEKFLSASDLGFVMIFSRLSVS